MKAGLAVIADGYVADRTENLALLVDLDSAVAFRSNVEPADGCPFEGADRRQRRRRNSRFIGEAGERCKRLLTRIQNDDVNLRLRIGGDMLALHCDLALLSPPRRNRPRKPRHFQFRLFETAGGQDRNSLAVQPHEGVP